MPLDGTGPGSDVASFGDQGAGAPQLELMPPQAATSLHFALTGAAPGATVALVGGQRGPPPVAPRGRGMDSGAGRPLTRSRESSGVSPAWGALPS